MVSNSKMSFTKRVPDSLGALTLKSYKGTRAYNFWFDPRTMAPFLDEAQYNLNATTTFKATSPAPAVSSPLKYVPGRTITETHEKYEHEDLRPYFQTSSGQHSRR